MKQRGKFMFFQGDISFSFIRYSIRIPPPRWTAQGHIDGGAPNGSASRVENNIHRENGVSNSASGIASNVRSEHVPTVSGDSMDGAVVNGLPMPPRE